ncbi:hypothetical protein SAMN02983003_0348 [Devosia enhydra]|uniref:EpsG family protein n=1 Tax=Devosia enhydra TaxID=665118 RepID=A0A1K2HT17_9HYPH|nr:hypothetical protein [Devosia enhydra]SFZ81162.1 hypothetical protein SAMN02983003_0348 [Devosia enhydra]
MQGAAEDIFAAPAFTPLRQRWALGLSIFFALLFLVGAIAVWHRFPDEFYSWTELMLSYAGGFMRRGLLGELAWQLRHVISPQLLLTALVWLAHTAVAIWFVRLVLGRPGLASLMFLFSPALLLLPLYDFEAFARKDAFIVLAVCLSISAARHVRALGLAIALIILAFTIAGLIHELAFFYMPLALVPIALRLHHTRGPRALWPLALGTAAYLALMLGFSIVFKGDAGDGALMIETWRQLYPGAFSEWPGAFGFIGNSLGQGLALQAFFVGRFQSWGAYGMGLLLTLLPLLLYLPGRGLDRHFDHRLLRIGLVLAIVSALMPFVIAGDWGRIINMFGLSLGALVLSLRPTEAGPDADGWWRASPGAFWAGWALFGLYVLSWRIRHSSPEDIALMPGTIFLIFGLAP